MSYRPPDEQTLKDLEASAIGLAQGAGKILSQYIAGNTEVSYKGKGETDPVTEADLRVEEYLREEITREFPEHGIVSEENTENTQHDADFKWVLDPIDGTANFAAGVPFYAISIGLLHTGVPVVSSLFLPNTFAGNGVYHARLGSGAFADETPLKVAESPRPQPTGLVGMPAGFARSLSFRRERGRGLGDVRVMGSIACEMVMVAGGLLQYSLIGAPRIWDVAAGVLLIKVAGGQILERKSGEWIPLQEFTAPPQRPNETPSQALRRWGSPLLLGPPAMLAYLAPRIRFRRRLSSYLPRRIRAILSGRR